MASGEREFYSLLALETSFCSDDVYLMCPSSDVSRTMDVFGKSQGEQETDYINGWWKCGLGIAKTLEKDKKSNSAKIIKTDR
ncbi:MAG: hypothetical protein CM15mP85_11450 [Rhodobacterales bacterium]|nr:MAG: hypothetical protein CM15mP85_11450 [Rhodobacterales bacterium]